MRKLNSLVISTLTAAFLVGCGGISDGTTSSSEATSPSSSEATSTSVPVTKGPLLMAIAKDGADKTGTQVAGTNKYTFEGDISYPITVTGGYVDVNNNGKVDAGDYEFTGKLSSFSNVVTPITTYLGDTSKDTGKAKLAALKTLAGVTSDDDLLKKDPSETNEDVLALVASIYQSYSVLMDNDDTNDEIEDDIEDEDSALKIKFDDYKDVISQGTSETETLKEKLIRVEEHLRDNSNIEILSEFQANKINLSKKDFVGKKLVVDNETYFFRENDIVLGDSGADYTGTANYGTIEDGILRVNFNNGDYDLIELTETGFDISYYENESLVGSPTSVTSELVDYTTAELSLVLADVAPIFTNELISGKVYYPNTNINVQEKIEFYSNGTLKAYHTYNSESGQVNEPWGMGDWLITNDGKLRTAFGEGTCYQFEISSVHGEGNISVNTTSDLTCNKASEMDEFNSDSIYTSLSFAETLTEGNTGNPSIFELTNEMISGKQIYISDEYGTFLGKFYSNGTYTEVWDDTKSNGNKGTCEGTWSISANFLNIIQTCSDSQDSEFVTLIFNEQPTAGVTFGVTVDSVDDGDTTITSISNIEEISTTNLVWESWATSNPSYRGEPITTLDNLIASFTDVEYSNWFTAMDNNDSDIEVTLSSSGNVVNVSAYEPYGGALHGSTVLGSWMKSNNMINITMNTGEKIHIRLGTSGVDYVIQVAYE